MLYSKSVVGFTKRIEQWAAEQRVIATEVGRGLSVFAFNNVLQHTAQFSGDMAANWKYQIGSINSDFQSNVVNPLIRAQKAPPFIMGDETAINYAKMDNSGKDASFTLHSTVYISNTAWHDSFYAWKVEKGTIKFRQGNKGSPVGRTVLKVGARFGGPLSPFNVTALRKLSIGVGV